MMSWFCPFIAAFLSLKELRKIQPYDLDLIGLAPALFLSPLSSIIIFLNIYISL